MNKNKFFLLTILLFGQFSFANAQSVLQFTDVPTTHPNYNAILVLKYEGILNGYEDQTYRPSQIINRVEALKLAFEASQFRVQQGIAHAQFSDIELGQWYTPYLNQALYSEIISGYPDNTFKPLQAVNRVEFLKMLLLAQKQDLSKTNLTEIPYSDIAVNAWYSKYINFAKINQLLDSDSKNQIFPGSPLTRAEAAGIIYRYRNYLRKNQQITEATTSTTTSTQTTTTPPTNTATNLPTSGYAQFVSSQFKFLIKYPEIWFYQGVESGTGIIRVYQFGNKDLANNPPLVSLAIKPKQEFIPNFLLQDLPVIVQETADSMIITRQLPSGKIYELTGSLSQVNVLKQMAYSVSEDITNQETYNNKEKKDVINAPEAPTPIVTKITETKESTTDQPPVVDSTNPALLTNGTSNLENGPTI